MKRLHKAFLLIFIAFLVWTLGISAAACASGVRGDLNGDGSVTILDIMIVVDIAAGKDTGDVPVKPAKAALSSQTLTVNGTAISGRVSNATGSFNFADDISVTNGATWVLSTDPYGMYTVITKTVPLNEGDNIFYIHVQNPDQTLTTYTVSLYRNHMYTVDFYTNCGTSIAPQYVEEGGLATVPTDEITKAGYTFASWSHDFTQPITSNVAVMANWTPNTDIPYKVEYYFQNQNQNGYELLDAETEYLTGTTDTTVTAPVKNFEHFTPTYYWGTKSGTVAADGSLVLKVYYTRNTYTVTTNCNDTDAGSVSYGGTYSYGESVALTATTYLGYDFLGWFVGDTKVCDTPNYTFAVSATETVEARFEIMEEMKNFFFTTTSESCQITGVKDTTVTTLTVPSCVTYVSYGAFKNCTNLTSLTLPEAFTISSMFGSDVLSDYCESVPSSLQTVIITGGTEIGWRAFSGCKDITTVTIPESVTSIEEYAFWYCRSLESVTFAEGSKLESIDEYAFYGCTSLASIKIPEGVTSIGTSAFDYCTSLTSVTFAEGSKLESIGYAAFDNCNNLASITIPEGVTSIGSAAFSGCTSLNSVDVAVGSKLESIGSYAFSYCTSLKSITIPEGVTSIGSYAFRNCTSLTSVTFAEGSKLGSIDEYAFYNCENLTSITIPEGVTSIGSYAFSGCKSLVSVEIPESVVKIGEYAFYHCENLTSITIPESVTSIGSYAFSGCTSLNSVDIADLAAWCKISFGNATANPLYYAKNLYLDGELVTELVIPADVESIGSYAFYYCTSLTSVTFAEGSKLESIGSYAFGDCVSLKSVNLPTSLTSIGNNAFSDCVSLKSVNFPTSLTSIGNDAFSDCVSLRAVNLPTSLTSIGNNAFSDCVSLKSVNLRMGLTSIGDRAFYNCTSLTSVTFAEGSKLESIGSYAFYNCENLTSITIPEGVTSIGTSAFAYCTSLNSVDVAVGSKLESIGSAAFYNCENLTSITIPEGVTSIGDDAFYYCTSLTSVTFAEGSKLESIGSYAFSRCTSLKSITIPEGVTSIGTSAFYSTGIRILGFKDASGWYRTTNKTAWENAAGGTEMDLTDITTNATYFKSTYRYDYWYKK